ncbi:MAG: hypothetical protein K0S08_1845 [Gammaproteobacteria bacterium]|jgi:hypothetical protein|nr:hypothetical protein [Gammaproteobacteria bacterium]
MATILIDFDHTIFRGHLHNLIINLYNDHFLVWKHKCAELEQARALADVASIEYVEKEVSSLAQQFDTRWAAYVFKNGYPKVDESDPEFDRRCFEFICGRPEYSHLGQQERNFAMQIHAASHTWKEVIEGLIDKGHKVVIASFSSFPGVLKIFLQEILQLDPAKLENIPMVSWLPECPDSENKNHHLVQGLLLAQHSMSDGDIVLIDDSQRHIEGAKELGYKTILATPDGRHLTEVFECYIQQTQASTACSDGPQCEQDMSAGYASELPKIHADISLYRGIASIRLDALEKILPELLKQDELVRFVISYKEAKSLFEGYKAMLLQLEQAAAKLIRLDKAFEGGPAIARELIHYFQQLPRIAHDLENMLNGFSAKFQEIYKKFVQLFQKKINAQRFNSHHPDFDNIMRQEYSQALSAVENFKCLLQDAQDFGVVLEHGDKWLAHVENVLSQAKLEHQAYILRQSKSYLSQPLVACSKIFLTPSVPVSEERNLKTPPPPPLLKDRDLKTPPPPPLPVPLGL